MMPDARKSTESAATAAEVLTRWRAWWRDREALGALEPHELDKIASDLGLTAPQLRDLVARGPRAADELGLRMHALGIDRADVDKVALGLMRDLERTCACCVDKAVCIKDLAEQPDDPGWAAYCPNATSLTCVTVAKEQVPA